VPRLLRCRMYEGPHSSPERAVCGRFSHYHTMTAVDNMSTGSLPLHAVEKDISASFGASFRLLLMLRVAL